MAAFARHSEAHLRSMTKDALVAMVIELRVRNTELAAELETLRRAGPSTPAPKPPPGATEGPGSLGPRRTGQASVELPGEKEALQSAVPPTIRDRPLTVQPRLERALSKIPANVNAAAQLRNELKEAVEGMVLCRQSSNPDGDGAGNALKRLTHSNFFLPDLSDEDPAFKTYIHSKLTAPHYQRDLEDQGVINTFRGDAANRLWVLHTMADGNCLLHATLLAIWGLHDTASVGSAGSSSIRAAMKRVFEDPVTETLIRRRWVQQMARDNVVDVPPSETDGANVERPRCIEVSDEQLAREWAEMVDIAGRQNAFLDSVHVLAVAHAMRRPIVIMANAVQMDPFGDPLTPVFFRGIYLPLERAPAHCCRQPLILCFKDAHFMPLVPVGAPEASPPVLVPLIDGSRDELPLRFALEEELSSKWELVEKYMDIERHWRCPTTGESCKAAVMRRDSSHHLVNHMVAAFVERGRAIFKAEREQEAAKRKCDEEAAVSAKRQKQEQEDETLDMKVPSETPKDPEEPDEPVKHKFEVRLPRGIRPGERTRYTMPKGCTEPSIVSFEVPTGCWGGDTVLLTANFSIKGHCIKSLRDVTGLPRAAAVDLLTVSHGNANEAAQRHFDALAGGKSAASPGEGRMAMT
mmetsp:Transcript_113654/g.321358  ORF Transcript_113654/g.321358 Transcript_113654/m.321358 type:complete len:635 (-) Transcript_113654:56-1960(-)